MAYGPKPKPPLERFWRFVDKQPDGCWVWMGSTCRGYGTFTVRRGASRSFRAHRFSYESFVGPIPDGMHLDHLCNNPLCVNPSHLEPVTPAENARRASFRRTECPKGHVYDLANTYIRPDGKGKDCRACRREAETRRAPRRWDRELQRLVPIHGRDER